MKLFYDDEFDAIATAIATVIVDHAKNVNQILVKTMS